MMQANRTAAWRWLATAALLAVAAPASAAGPFDGTYAGGTIRERGDTGTCGPDQGHATVTVVDGKFNYAWNPAFHVVVTSEVAPDGAVTGSQVWAGHNGRPNTVRVTGRIANGTLDVVFDSAYCARRFVLKKSA